MSRFFREVARFFEGTPELAYDETDVDPFDDVHFAKYNPYHDRLGRFTTKGGAVNPGYDYRPQHPPAVPDDGTIAMIWMKEDAIQRGSLKREPKDLQEFEEKMGPTIGRIQQIDPRHRTDVQAAVNRVWEGRKSSELDKIVDGFGKPVVIAYDNMDVRGTGYANRATGGDSHGGFVWVHQHARSPEIGAYIRSSTASAGSDPLDYVVRHEYGHVVARHMVDRGVDHYPEWRSAWEKTPLAQGDASAFSRHAATSADEAWADMFAGRTNPNFALKNQPESVKSLYRLQGDILDRFIAGGSK
jgi:hypothetical protein